MPLLTNEVRVKDPGLNSMQQWPRVFDSEDFETEKLMQASDFDGGTTMPTHKNSYPIDSSTNSLVVAINEYLGGHVSRASKRRKSAHPKMHKCPMCGAHQKLDFTRVWDFCRIVRESMAEIVNRNWLSVRLSSAIIHRGRHSLG